jgi:hypothetical protein
VPGRSDAARRGSPGYRLERGRVALAAHPLVATAAIWLIWLAAVLLTVAIGIAAGAYRRGIWADHLLFPLFTWDFGWYDTIALHGYAPHPQALPPEALQRYAFFPLWPWLLRASGRIPDWEFAGALTLAASALAFFGLAASRPDRSRRHVALALACWPGSSALLLAYPDGLALAAGAWAAALALRDRLLAAGLVGAVAALARPSGFLIALPLAWLAHGKGPRAWAGAAVPMAAAAGVEAFFWERSGAATTFFDAQKLWGRKGPARFGDWLDHVGGLLERHGLLIGLLAVGAAAAIVLAWRQFGFWPTAVVAYAGAVALLLAATQSLEAFVDSGRAALIVPLLVVLWRLGPRYRPWAAFATAVIALLLLSGTMQSFGRQSLFAFPIFWAIAEGPRWLRLPPLAVLGFAANLGLALLLTHFAP